MNHIMLSSMGTSILMDTEYILDGKIIKSQVCAFALQELLPLEDRPDKILFLLTPKAKTATLNQINIESKARKTQFDLIDLPSEEIIDDSGEFLRIVSNGIPEGSRITLDITGGLRHHAFLLYTLALYLGEFRQVDVRGMWYCRYEIGIKEKYKPFIDLKPALKLSNWFHALSVFKETGSLYTLSKLLDNEHNEKVFQNYSSLFLIGMPLESGKEAFHLVNKLKLSLEKKNNLLPNMPLVEEIKNRIINELDPLLADYKRKENLLLNEDELKRQAAFISKYLETDQLNLAFGLMREWVINKILLSRNNKSDWLYKKARHPVELLLGSMQAVFKLKTDTIIESMSENQIKWANFWGTLTEVRNQLQHHGMKPNVFFDNWKMVKKLKNFWPELKEWPAPKEFGGGEGKLLICPLGQTAGVLFSALKLTQPNRCLIVCSSVTKITAVEAINQSHWTGDVEYLVMENPFTGFDEFNNLKKKAAIWLFEADSIHGGITGGTSLMGALITELTYYAERNYQRNVSKFVLIDKRLPQQQREKPWVVGEIQYLEQNSEL